MKDSSIETILRILSCFSESRQRACEVFNMVIFSQLLVISYLIVPWHDNM